MKLSAKEMIERLLSSGLSQRVIGERVGTAQPTVTRWRAGENEPWGRNLDAIRELYDEVFPDDQPEKPTKTRSGLPEIDAKGIPNLTVDGGMGTGSVEVVTRARDGKIDKKYLSGYWNLPPDVRSMVPNLWAVHAIPVRGDSMYPTLSSGNIVFIDTSHRHPSPPDIYAMDYGDGLVVKRLDLVPRKKTISVISDNKLYETFEVNRSDVQVYGRVVGIFQWRG